MRSQYYRKVLKAERGRLMSRKWRSKPRQLLILNDIERERERQREFIGANIKQFHAKLKLRRWDTEKNPAKQVVPSGALESFINFYRGLKLMADLVRI